MTEALPDMSLSEQVDQGEEALVPASAVASSEELEIARELVASARARGVALTGPEGLLKALTKTVIETALDEELADHLGYDKHDPAGRNGQNSRNGKRTKTVLTDMPGRSRSRSHGIATAASIRSWSGRGSDDSAGWTRSCCR